MSRSYTKIDYRLRVAKSVERKMMSYLFQQLSVFAPLKEYTYIGFGSVAFLDFALFHRLLGIDKMISIEKEETDRTRFEFNKPYACIDLQFGESKDILPKLDIEKKCIVWLDYDGKLSTAMLDDIVHLFRRLPSGSMFCLSFNSHIDHPSDEDGSRYNQLINRIDSSLIPSRIHDNSILNKKELKQVYYEIITNLIDETLHFRLENGESMCAQQMLYVDYNDGVDMTTLGWLIYDISDEDKMESIVNVNQPEFVKKEDESFIIRVPILTHKEMKTIETAFPNLPYCIKQFHKGGKGGFLPKEDIESYYNIYKYFSSFGEIHI